MSEYNPYKWYWLADDARVYSGPLEAIVTEADQGYVDWLAAGFVPTPWPRDDAGVQTNTALQAVLEPLGMCISLSYYAIKKRWQTETGGITVTVAGGPVPIKTDDRAQANINGQRLKAQADNTFTTQWQGTDYTFYPLTAADVIAMSDQLQAHVTNCFATSKTLVDGIVAGTITTRAQVDAAFAALIP